MNARLRSKQIDTQIDAAVECMGCPRCKLFVDSECEHPDGYRFGDESTKCLNIQGGDNEEKK